MTNDFVLVSSLLWGVSTYTVCSGYLRIMRIILGVGSVSFCSRMVCGLVSWRICSRLVISYVGILLCGFAVIPPTWMSALVFVWRMSSSGLAIVCLGVSPLSNMLV